jgi:hypothetical protein
VSTGAAVKCRGELVTKRIADDEPALIAIRTSTATTDTAHLARTALGPD